MAHFDERSGIVPCKTEWGNWWQTLEEVYVEVNPGKEISAKVVECDIKARHLKVVVNREVLINVRIPSSLCQLNGLKLNFQIDYRTWAFYVYFVYFVVVLLLFFFVPLYVSCMSEHSLLV